MYKIEKRPSGFLLTFSGSIDAAEMRRWEAEARIALVGATPPFGVIIDMRTLAPLAPEVQAIMVGGQKAFMDAGMKRSCVIVADSILAMQFARLARQSGIYAFERYIDASSVADWATPAVAWTKNGVDPDKKKAA